MILLAHRGLDKGVLPNSGESSLKSFTLCAQKGFGFEFDLQITKDRKLIVWHDADIERLSHGQEAGYLRHYAMDEIQTLAGTQHVCRFEQLLELIQLSKVPLAALHWKGENQNLYFAEVLAEYLKQTPGLHQRLLVFDVRKEWGEWLHEQFPQIQIALSVAHPFDVQRFGAATGNTLYSPEEALAWRAVGQWAWLDEWDLIGADGGKKEFYTYSICKSLRQAGIKIALISPELHPRHPDGQNKDLMEKRWAALNLLGVDAICTDFASRWNLPAV